jgi:hypothetical protein
MWYGGRWCERPQLFHGKSSLVQHERQNDFRACLKLLGAGRYHSLIVERESLPECLEISATTPNGTIMGLRHRTLKVKVSSFIRKSIMTAEGKTLLANFLKHEIETYSVPVPGLMLITTFLSRLTRGENLPRLRPESFLECLLNGEATDVQIAATFDRSKNKRRNSRRTAGLAEGMRRRAVPIKSNHQRFIDTAWYRFKLRGRHSMSLPRLRL